MRVREGLRYRGSLSARQLARTGVRFVRAGDNLYLEGSELELGSLLVDDPVDDLLDLEDVFFDNQAADNNTLFEQEPDIELEEINTSEVFGEDIPLIESGVTASAGVASSGGVSTGAVIGTIAGVTAVGGVIAVATTLGSDDSEHTKPVVSVDPEHNFIGPGNTLDTGAVPLDVDDDIAQDHDRAYESAKTQEDVQRADKEGANEFLTDVIENQNPHSIAGYIGLTAKEKLESVIGVQYPPNLPS